MRSGRQEGEQPGGAIRKMAVWALYATALTPIVFSSGTIYPYVVPRSVFFRTWTAIAAVIAIYLLVIRRSGAVSGVSGERTPDAGADVSGVSAGRHRPLLRDPVLLVLGAFVAIQLVAALAGEAPTRSLFGDMERMGGVLAWVHFLAFYFALRTLPTGRETMTFFRIVMVVTVVVTGIAILQSLGVTIGILPGTAGRRAIGTLGNAGYLGIYGVLGIGVAGLVWRRSAGFWRVAAQVAVAVNAWALALTYTRAALAGLGAGLLVGLVAYGAMAGWRRRRLAIAAVAGVALVLGIGAWAVWGRTTGARGGGAADGGGRGAIASGVALLEHGLGNRFSAWRAGARALADDPLTGLGGENFRLAFDWHFDPERYGPLMHYTRAHNDLVESLVAAGIPGGLAWLALWGAAFYVLFRARREGKLGAADATLVGGALAAYLVYLLFWFHEENSLPIALALAAFGGLQRDGPYLDRRGIARRAPVVRVTAAFLLTLVVGADIAHHGRLIAAGSHLAGARRAPALEARISRYQRALELRPPGAEEVVTELVRFATVLPGAVGERLRDPGVRARVAQVQDTARRALSDLIEGDPRNPRLYREAGRLDVIRYQLSRNPAHLASSVVSLDSAIALAPGRIRYRHMLSEVYLLAERPDSAVRVLEEGLAGYAELGETHYFLAKALLIAGEHERAAESLVRAYEMGYRRGSTQAVRVAIIRALRERGKNDVADHVRDVWRTR